MMNEDNRYIMIAKTDVSISHSSKAVMPEFNKLMSNLIADAKTLKRLGPRDIPQFSGHIKGTLNKLGDLYDKDQANNR